MPSPQASPQSPQASSVLRERSPVLVFLFSVLTLGIYLIYWYSCVYAEWQELTGSTPTGNQFALDLLFGIVTCGIWGIYVDYRISQELTAYRVARGLAPRDTTMAVLILDVAAYVTISITFLISSALQQDLINDLRKELAG